MDHNRYYNAGSDAEFWSERSPHEFYGTFATWRAILGLDADSSQGDPGIDAGGHIMADSRMIDAGRALGSVSDDFDGEPRTGPHDIGADEFPRRLASGPAGAGEPGGAGRLGGPGVAVLGRLRRRRLVPGGAFRDRPRGGRRSAPPRPA